MQYVSKASITPVGAAAPSTISRNAKPRRPAQRPNAFLTHGTNLVMTERRLRVECRLPFRTRAANRRLLSVHPRPHIEARQSLFARSVGNDEKSQEIADHLIGNDGVWVRIP